MAEAKRKLAAILSADVAGYSRLMGDDERATVRTLTDYRDVFRDHIERHHGRVVDTPGDNLMAEFASPVEAVEAAAEIQRELARRNRQLAEHRRMDFRIGINLGDVLERDGALFGDGINIAARLESLAEAGGICISGTVFDQVKTKVLLGFDFFGEQEVKNIAEPVRVYRVRVERATVENVATKAASKGSGLMIGMAAATAIVAVITSVAFWWMTQPASVPSTEAVTESADAVLELPDGPAIAVIPFENLSGDPEQEFFSDGLTEDLIARLSNFANFFVIARNSTKQYKGRAVDVREINRDLGARYVVEGSVRRDANTVRVTVQLLDAETGTHLWAETYDRDLTAASLFEIQDGITERVAATIADEWGVLARANIQSTHGKPTDSLEAYECTLLAVAHYEAITPATHLRARECLERAIELDPNYASAWAWLAMIYDDEHLYAFNLRPNPQDRAMDAARRAAELNTEDGWARTVLAWVHFHRHELGAFRAEADRALRLQPNNASTLSIIGLLLVNMGEIDRGVALLDKATKLNPYHPDWYYFPISHAYYHKGQYEESLAAALKIRMTNYYWTHVLLARAYGQLGRKTEGQTAVDNLLKYYSDYPANARDDFRKWNFPEFSIVHQVEGLRKAGLDVPDEPAADD